MAENEPLNVTLITRNNRQELLTTAVGVAIYGACLWFLFHPNEVDKLKLKIQAFMDRIWYKISILQTRAAIRALPEIPD